MPPQALIGLLFHLLIPQNLLCFETFIIIFKGTFGLYAPLLGMIKYLTVRKTKIRYTLMDGVKNLNWKYSFDI